MNKFVIRLFNNQKYGKYTGINKINKIVLNGTIDILGQDKYLIDMVAYIDADQAFDQKNLKLWLDCIDEAVLPSDGFHGTPRGKLLISQIWIRDKNNEKQPRTGFVALNPDTNKLFVVIYYEDEEKSIKEILTVHGCNAEKGGKKSPDFIAANYDLPKRA